MVLKVKRLKGSEDIPLPHYASEDASGLDIRASVRETIIIHPNEIRRISTGLAVAIPRGYEAQIRPRSGLALKYGVGMVNSPGTIDADYRGEIGIILINWGSKPFRIHRGDRIAQMTISKVFQPELVEVDSLDNTQRGQGGFGHTGVR